MCLTLTALSIAGQGTLTLYKVYHKQKGKLTSPYFYYYSGGCIEKPGTFQSWPETSVSHQFWSNRRGYALMPPIDKDIGSTLIMGGFHCLTSIESARIYHFAEQYRHPTVIVPVLVEATDVFAVGDTETNTGENYKLLTYVAKSITITPEAFNTAMSE